jgi:CHAD domain-containing protein
MKSYLLPDPSDPDGIREAIRVHFPVKTERINRSNLVYYDTFDWLIYNNARYLALEKNKLTLYKAPDDIPLVTEQWTKSSPPKFWTDLPAGTFQQEIRSMIDVRALLPYGSVNKSRQQIRILNEDDKTVVFTEIKELKPESGEGAFFLSVRPLRGYDAEYTQFTDFLSDLGLKEVPEQAAFHYIQVEGRRPGDYSSKVKISLEENMTALQAVQSILLSLLDVAEQNLPGMIEDIDMEFLHDFRVAIRRMRSAISEIQGVYSDEHTRHFYEQLRMIGKSTNRLRDLDVYLLHREEYYDQLPDSLKNGLNTLFAKLAKQRSWEHKNLVKMIEGGEFADRLLQWREFLTTKPAVNQVGPNANKPVLPLARYFIYKAYTKVIKLGKKIHEETPDKKLHKLRIECKRLRYLLEFFSSLFPADEISYLIRRLKKLQDNLGTFNDLSVQQETMYEYMQEVDWSNKSAPTITAALGGLITGLNLRQMQVRKEFEQTFNEFSCEENIALFRRLFNPQS